MTVRSAWHINPGQTRQDSRMAPVGTYTPLDATQTRAGVIPGGTGLNLTGATMTGTIAIGRAVVQGTATQGAYPVVVTAAETFTVANGHASLPRIDSVFVVAYDQLFDTSGQTLAAIVYVQGTANASPVAPTAPATGTAYLRLWDIAVPAGASAGAPINWATALTDRRVYTVPLGGIVPTSDAVAGAYVGQYRDNPGTGALERWSGSAWVAWSAALGGIAPGTLGSGAYAGQYRDGANGLERWSGAAWVPVGTWTNYTPTWTGSVTNPAIGNGTIDGRYVRVGKMVTAVINITFGSTTNAGAGVYNFGLPVAAITRTNANWAGSASALHSGAALYTSTSTLASALAYVNCWAATNAGGGAPNPWGGSNPFNWTNGDVATIAITYETA